MTALTRTSRTSKIRNAVSKVLYCGIWGSATLFTSNPIVAQNPVFQLSQNPQFSGQFATSPQQSVFQQQQFQQPGFQVPGQPGFSPSGQRRNSLLQNRAQPAFAQSQLNPNQGTPDSLQNQFGGSANRPVINAGGRPLTPKFMTISQNVGHDPAILSQIEQVASRYPLCIIVGEGVASQIIYSETIEDGPFEEEIMGARVRGQQRTVARTAIDFLPSETSVKMNFVLSGSSQSSTLSSVRQAAVQSSSTVDFDITKEVDFDGTVFATRSPAAFMKINQQNLGASTAVSPIPLLGSLANDIVMNAAEQRRPYTETIAAHRITQMIAPTFNQQIDQALLDLNARLSNQVRPMLQQAQMEPSHIATRSTPEAGIWGIAFERGQDSTAGLGILQSVGFRGDRARRLPARRLGVSQPGISELMQQQMGTPQQQLAPSQPYTSQYPQAQPQAQQFQPVQPLNPQPSTPDAQGNQPLVPTPASPSENGAPVESIVNKPQPAIISQPASQFSPEMANVNNRLFILVHESLIEDIATRYELSGRDVDPEIFQTILSATPPSDSAQAPIGVLKLAEDRPVTATISKEEFQVRVLAGFQPTVGPEIPIQETLFSFKPVMTDDSVILRPILKSIKPVEETNDFAGGLMKIAGETVVRSAIEQRLKEYVLPRSIQLPRDNTKAPLSLRLQSISMSDGWLACVYEPVAGIGQAKLPFLESVMLTAPTIQ